ncbi:MAG: replicative DNA helicase [Dehalococcoidia bacterium]|nr:replicative DNA helicase [Dehalococcoidia bacterium]
MYAERLLPHDIEAEEAVIGSLLIDGDSIMRVTSFLKPTDFYREKNRLCYEACLDLFRRGEAINQVTVAHQLAIQEHLEPLGGAAYLSHLISTVPTSVHIEHYGHIVNRTATMRNLIDAAANISALGYDDTEDVDATLSQAEGILFRVRSGQPARDFMPLREILDQYLEERAAVSEPLGLTGAPVLTGFDSLDQLLGGLHRSDMVVLAARPSLGKSTLAINISLNAAKSGARVAVFSLEMSREQIAMRMIAGEAGVDAQRLRMDRYAGLSTEAQERQIIDSIGALSELPIYIDDTPLQGIMEMRSKARRLHVELGLDMLVVDYMQLIEGGRRDSNRVQEISEITRSIKGMARDLNIPILAVSQLSRAVEMRTSHRPQLSDLRESGSIEQDADVVMFIYRDDVYNTEDEWTNRFPDRPYPKNIAEIIVAKHRHGPVGNLELFFRDNLVRFESLPVEQGAF